MSDTLQARGAGMDPVSVMACRQAVAGIPKRWLRKSCQLRVVVGAQVPSSPLMDRLRGLLRTSLQKLGTFASPLLLLCG